MALWVDRALADARRVVNGKLRVGPTADTLNRNKYHSRSEVIR